MTPIIAVVGQKSTSTRHFRNVIATLALALCFCTGSFRKAHCVELIINGSFEDDGFSGEALLTGWSDGPGAGNDRGFAILEHLVVSCDEDGCDGSGFSAMEFPEPFGRVAVKPNGAGDFFGRRWGTANGTGFSGSATQIVSLSEYASMPYEFSAWLASRLGSSPTDDLDYAIVSIEFFTGPNGNGDSLGSAVFDGDDQMSPFIVGSLNGDGIADPTVPATQDNWTFYRATGTIPELAQSASVVIRGATSPVMPSNGSFGLVDLVSLQVIPEPSTVALLVGVGPILFGWYVARRQRKERR